MLNTIKTGIMLTGDRLTLDQVWSVAHENASVTIDPASMERVVASRQRVEDILKSGSVVYGITTGFGQFKDRRIPTEDVATLQRNLIISHAASVGEPFSIPITRALMLLRANALAKGFSGIRPETLTLLVECLNRGVHPVLPQQGSVGSSGDLAILAHLALVLLGLGKAEYQGEILDGAEALKKAGLTPVVLQAKEGLALINGTQAMTAVACELLTRAQRLAKICDITCGMTLEAVLGTARAYEADLHRLRPHPGQMTSAENLCRIVDNSELRVSHKDCNMVQDAYSLRCAPQVHGASRDGLGYAKQVVEIELNSATDNPLILDNGEVYSGGHFHGQPVALAMDFAAIAISELANISERRIERLVNPAYSNGLPAFLTEHGGLNSGYMIAQYTAASLVSENKSLAHPASVDSIPTSAGQEDHVSMGTTAARKALKILDNAEYVVAIEILCAAQGLDFRQPKPGKGVLAAHACVREALPHLGEDRYASADIQAVHEIIQNGKLLDAVEKAIGELK